MRSLGWSYVDPLNLLGDSGGNYIFSEFPGRFWCSLRHTHVVNLIHTVSQALGIWAPATVNALLEERILPTIFLPP